MRTLLVAMLLLGAGDAVARRHAKPKKVVHVVKDTRAADQYARAEAELAELRASTSLPAEAPPERVHYEQDSDRETPPGLRR